MSCHGTRVVVIKIPEGEEIALSTHGVISNDAPEVEASRMSL